jgi:hypothetical protein
MDQITRLTDEQISKLADRFYDIITNNRHQLSSVLKEDKVYTTYETLSRLFLEINRKYTYTDGNIITDLLIGNIGLECNKQKAIYELPTFELMCTIFSIVIYFNVKNIEEIMAGQGLFASLFRHYFIDKNNTNILNFNATDGMCQCETFSNPYYPIEKKYIVEYLIEKETNGGQPNEDLDLDKMFIAIWPNMDMHTAQLQEFITEIKPAYFILVGQKGMYKTYSKVLKNSKYEEVTFLPYQICFKDTITEDGSKDGSTLPDISHSSVTLFIKDGFKKKEDLCEIGNNIKILANSLALSDDIFRSRELMITDLYVIKFLTEQHMIPPTIVKNISDSEIRDLVVCLYNLSKLRDPVHIPEYLISLGEFKFWYNLHRANKFPKLVKKYNRFKNFMMLYEEIDSTPFIPSNIMIMKDKNIFPQWVSSKHDAIKCLILDYSTGDNYKVWKQSKQIMNEFYNSIFKTSVR